MLHFVDMAGADTVIPFSSGSKIIRLGTGYSFNVSSYDGYENFSVNNFKSNCLTGSFSAGSTTLTSDVKFTFVCSRSYKTSTGVYSFSYTLKANTRTVTIPSTSVETYLVI